MALISGVMVSLGGRDFQIPPLSFAHVKRFTVDGTFAKVDAIGTDNDGIAEVEKLGAIALVIHAAISRNYPETTAEEVESLLDEHNAGPALLAVRGITFKPKPEKTPGEP